MYAQYYLQAKEAAEQIRQRKYEGPVETKGFMGKRTKATDYFDPKEMVLDYMLGVQESFQKPAESATGSVDTAVNAIAQIESGGNYQAVGPVVSKGMYKGDRAYGKYQVMGKNIPQFTKEALGKSLTVDQFLADEKAQDLVARYYMKKNYEKHGTWEDAASVWFSGRPMAQAGNDDDGYTSVPEYIQKFRNALRSPA